MRGKAVNRIICMNTWLALASTVLVAAPRASGSWAADESEELVEALQAGDTEFRDLLEQAQRDRALREELLELPGIVVERLSEAGSWPADERDLARRRACAVVQALGTAAAFAEVVELARPREQDGGSVELLGASARDAIAALLVRDLGTHGLVKRSFAGIDGRLRPWVLHAVGRTDQPECITLLIQLMGVDPALDATVLSMINRLAARVQAPGDLPALLAVEHALLVGEPDVRRQAALALGRLGSYESVPQLIELITSDDDGLSRNAHWSLKQLSGTSLRRDHDTWASWLQREKEWWARRGATLLLQLDHGDLAVRVAAIRELAHHPLFRSHSAPEISTLLHGCTPTEARLACVALAELGLAPDLDLVIEQLEHAHPSVRTSALAALESLTGKQLGPDPAPWRALR